MKLENGRTKLAVGGKISEYIPNPTFDVVARPGAQEEYYRKGNPEGKSRRELFGEPIKSPPAFREPASRLELMDEQGIDRTLMFPTLASVIEERMKHDPYFLHAAIHGSTSGCTRRGSSTTRAASSRRRSSHCRSSRRRSRNSNGSHERGAKVVLIRPAPVPGFRGTRSFALPEFDPFWKRVVELDILVALHSSDSGYDQIANGWEGSDQEMLPFKPAAFRMLSSWRPIEDAIASLVAHGALQRFPQLKIAVVENGGVVGRAPPAGDEGHVQEDAAGLPGRAGGGDAAQHLHQPVLGGGLRQARRPARRGPRLFGSDYPHPEGLENPVAYANDLEHHGPERVAQVHGRQPRRA